MTSTSLPHTSSSTVGKTLVFFIVLLIEHAFERFTSLPNMYALVELKFNNILFHTRKKVL